MTLEFIDSVYKEIFRGDVSYLVMGSRAIGGTLLIISLSKSIFKNFSGSGKVFSESEGGFGPHELYRMLFLLGLVMVIPQLLSAFDSICAGIESSVVGSFESNFPDAENLSEVKLDLPPPNETVEGGILRKLGMIAEYLNPMSWTGGCLTFILEYILKLIDFIIYPVFLAHRYFVLGLIKIFAPLLVALSIYDKTRDYVYTIFKMYGIYFLVIIPYAFATIFVNELHDGIVKMIYAQGTTGEVTMIIAKGPITVVAMVMCILIKLKLYKTSLPFMKELIK